MGQIGISIVKRCVFRDSVQEFANTYHYGSVDANPSEATAETLIDELVANEKTFHSSAITFVRASCWSSGGSASSNVMIKQKILSGVGATVALSGGDPERAFLIMWPAGTDGLGRPVFLKKWYHAVGTFGGVAPSTAVQGQSTGFTQANRDAIAAAADVVTRIGSLSQWGLVAESGRTRSGGLLSADPPICHKYYEHHQLGDQWRG